MHAQAVPTTITLQAIGEPHRRAILDRLRAGEQPVGALVADLAMSQPAVSKHLRVLRDAGLVEARVEGARRLYRIRAEPLAELAAWLETYRMHWTARLDQLEAHLEERRST